MPIVVDNLLRTATDSDDREQIKELLATGSVRIEQIVSHGQASPEGFWYDQPEAEWVVLLQGSATLLIEGEPGVTLGAGDYLLIPAHLRHRVERTSEDALWLAVHFRDETKVTSRT
ncbi:MAG: cupin domain-containing protein [Chthoniobacter sp.]|uniref:cupin domain-containing protein n=1 Tax=Chthoniobacter sp. TaxID=2510640 RepID=UPI0032A29A4C